MCDDWGMSRRYPADYAGARGSATISAIQGLDPLRWQVQRKIDGMYAVVRTDGDGRVVEVRSRTGRRVGERLHRLTGERVGAADSVLVGELEAHTEAGRLAAESRPGGLPAVHLFDCLVSGGRSLLSEPYRVRRDELCRAHYQLQDEDDGRGYLVDRMGQAYDPSNGRWCDRIAAGWRRAPVVEQVAPRAASRLWDEYVEPGGEGLVVVSLDARVGVRSAKQKIKPRDTLDAVVVEVTGERATCRSFGRTFAVKACSRIRAGVPVEVTHSGYYADGTPRFARAVSVRSDL